MEEKVHDHIVAQGDEKLVGQLVVVDEEEKKLIRKIDAQ